MSEATLSSGEQTVKERKKEQMKNKKVRQMCSFSASHHFSDQLVEDKLL